MRCGEGEGVAAVAYKGICPDIFPSAGEWETTKNNSRDSPRRGPAPPPPEYRATRLARAEAYATRSQSSPFPIPSTFETWFLKTGARGSAQGNFGLMDLVAGLHWLRENLPAFGGDPERITIMGHGTGAALANFIAVSPVAKELLHRVVLLSGSGLSPWALQRDPLFVKRKVAERTGCHGDLLEDDLAPCLRDKSLAELMAVRVDSPRFLPGFAPFIDGTVLVTSRTSTTATDDSATGLLLGAAGQQAASSAPGFEMADFPERDLLFGLTTTESYLDLSAQDLEFGFNESRRDRILRTYVRNAYYYHLNEIFSTLKNEYTDWERPVQNPLNVRDATLEVLSDGHTVAPLIRVGYLHTLRGGRTYFLHFHHQSSERDFPQRMGSVRGEDVPYVLGLPLVGGQPFFPHNYTRQDAAVARLLMHYLANFARKGDPNSTPTGRVELQPSPSDEPAPQPAPFWDTYDSINQLYMELGVKSEMRNHYRGHKMSLWLNLIPQLHRPGEDDLSMRHHHFQEEGAQYYEGLVRQQTLMRPNVGQYPLSTTSTTPVPSTSTRMMPTTKRDHVTTTTECPPNATGGNPVTGIGNLRPASSNNNNNNNLLRKLASSHYQSYTTALTVTIAVGCFLLLLNILIFAGIYHQRDRGSSGGHFGDKKKEELAEAGSCSSSSGETHHFESKHALVDHLPPSSSHPSASGVMVELPLQEFKSSPTSGVKRANCTGPVMIQQPPSYVVAPNEPISTTATTTVEEPLTSPSIPEPPPPPKAQPPTACNQTPSGGGGILRQQGCPQTPGTMKKRVQIQEISV
ncbi:neuroligin-1-like [Anabrus simplex]|uniref:neuroligin-1-like n=1 Tax=Anabrus simplex TaxID=316456 RepID=UPI0035A342E0